MTFSAPRNSLAKLFAKLLVPVFQDQEATAAQIGAVLGAFEQQFLEHLGNAYRVTAGIELDVQVNAEIDTSGGTETPRLYGNFVSSENAFAPGDGSSTSANTTLTAAKLELEDDRQQKSRDTDQHPDRRARRGRCLPYPEPRLPGHQYRAPDPECYGLREVSELDLAQLRTGGG